ncbi:hypothetical protein [Streptomyces sp. NPDC058751]|uniref:hypothetical protein n=1 Tax=Streptomyces sp. NPDC058751 TaxID=3346623 RepID=UPI0036BAD7AB
MSPGGRLGRAPDVVQVGLELGGEVGGQIRPRAAAGEFAALEPAPPTAGVYAPGSGAAREPGLLTSRTSGDA